MKIIKIEVIPLTYATGWQVYCDCEDEKDSHIYTRSNEAEAWAKVQELKAKYPDAFIVPKQGMP